MSKTIDDVDRMSMKELQREVRRLRQTDAERLNLGRMVDDAQIAGAGAGEMLKIAREQRDRYKTENNTLLTMLNELTTNLPMEIIDPAVAQKVLPNLAGTGNSWLGFVIFTRDDNTSKCIRLGGDRLLWPGDAYTAAVDFFKAVGTATYRAPLPSDIGEKTLAGVSRDEIRSILEELTAYRDLLPDEYQAKQRDLFNAFWPQMRDSGCWSNRSTAQDHFKKFIDRTFEHRDRHMEQLSVSVVLNEIE